MKRNLIYLILICFICFNNWTGYFYIEGVDVTPEDIAMTSQAIAYLGNPIRSDANPGYFTYIRVANDGLSAIAKLTLDEPTTKLWLGEYLSMVSGSNISVITQHFSLIVFPGNNQKERATACSKFMQSNMGKWFDTNR